MLNESIRILNLRITELINFFRQNLDYNKMVYEFWSAKDILGHLTFWHESFARNVKDLADGIKPTPLKGKLSEVNKQSVETTRQSSIEFLITRLQSAQEIISQNIVDQKIDLIPYKKGSRDYSKLEHLQIVEQHIYKHLKALNKSYN